ncbi:MAG TPA: FAD-dependent oxidoreductase, partial [Thermoleophilaceae bacterium]|nr:FAD-dependent oxidoreductase [Thermoleophilaceae bacterium]
TVFEAGPKVGGHTNTIRVDTEYETHHVDTGFIVFNDRNYPNFERLLVLLGVAWQPSQMSFGVSDSTGEFEYSSVSPNGLFATRRHIVSPRFHHMLVEVRRFQREAHALLTRGDGDPTLGEWLEQLRFSRLFIDRLIVPQASAVWSADPGQMWTFPARFLLSFFDNHGVLSLRDRPKWKTVTGGSHTYVDALTAAFADRIRVSTPVHAIERHDAHVTVTPRGGEAERYDHVVIAAHSNQALRMLTDASDREHEILGAIPYQPNEAVLHTDRRLLPRRRRAWASWNYHLGGEPSGRTRVTYHMNRLQSLSADREFCVTLNRSEAIDPETVIKTIQYDHPVYTSQGAAAQKRHEEISRAEQRTHYCGAYWGWGFHEDGVVSALRVCERLGARLA